MLGRKKTDTVTLKDVPVDKFIQKFAEHLKTSVKLEPLFFSFHLKTGHGKTLAPYDPDWYYIRAASIARKIYLKPKIGIGRLSHIYGIKRRKGFRLNKHSRGSRKIIRHIVSELVNADVLMRWNSDKNKDYNKEEYGEVEENMPVIVSYSGRRRMNDIANGIFKEMQAEASTQS